MTCSQATTRLPPIDGSTGPIGCVRAPETASIPGISTSRPYHAFRSDIVQAISSEGRLLMPEEATQVLAQFAAALAYEQLPNRVKEHCKNLLLDALACALAGATLFNGYLITAVTMCDAHRSTMTHVTPEVVPPALAIAERDDLSGRDLLVAIAAGCEVTTRIGIGLDYPAFRARGFHGPGVLGPFGAAAAVGRLRGFDAETMAKAFGLAGSQAAGTFAAWGTPTVKFHQC